MFPFKTYTLKDRENERDGEKVKGIETDRENAESHRKTWLYFPNKPY